MSVFHTHAPSTTRYADALAALQGLQREVRRRLNDKGSAQDFERFEREVHALFVQTEREVLAEGLQRLDVDLPSVVIGGQVHRRVLRSTETYLSGVGAVRVMRTLYRAGGEPAVVPLERRAGIVEGHWTPLAARQAAVLVAHLTPQEAQGVLRELGNMCPSKSSLDRLPKRLAERWEGRREEFEALLREAVEVPEAATTVAISLDGVMVPMKDGQRQAKRAGAQAQGKETRGPAGFREVGRATLSFHDAQGDRLETLRIARMPEPKKATLKSALTAEVEAVLARCPGLTLVKLADGAADNWEFLTAQWPGGVELVDFFHAAEQLKAAFDAAYGEHTPKALAPFQKYRHILLEETEGVEQVIRMLCYLRKKHPRRKRIAQVLGYFRRHRHRMRYAAAKAHNLPVGSGVVEAACKTLATQRLKRSGMHCVLSAGVRNGRQSPAQRWKVSAMGSLSTRELPEC